MTSHNEITYLVDIGGVRTLADAHGADVNENFHADGVNEHSGFPKENRPDMVQHFGSLNRPFKRGYFASPATSTSFGPPLSTALMRRTPDELLSSFWILKLPSTPVCDTWGPPQISLLNAPMV